MDEATKFWMGLTIITVPTIAYGGLVLLGILSRGAAGIRIPIELSETQTALFRAGHAHAGVLLAFGLILQMALPATALPSWLLLATRISIPLFAIFISGGFFGLAFRPGFRGLLYLGGLLLLQSTLTVGIGLLLT